MIVERLVRKMPRNGEGSNTLASAPLRHFRNCDAWALLGEPGSGKTEALKQEATETNGKLITVAQFLIEPPTLNKDTVLFLDGLDEYRVGQNGGSVALQVGAQLRRLGVRRFRIACRSADWLGESDGDPLFKDLDHHDVLELQPLPDSDVYSIVNDTLKRDADAVTFIARAKKLGLGSLLANPQSLNLLLIATRGNPWPATRRETFELACDQLVGEQNKRYRDHYRNEGEPSKGDVLDAAGSVCALLLLANKEGIALDTAQSNVSYPTLEALSVPDQVVAGKAVRTCLFRAGDREECVVSSHRMVSEYLAARWIARQLESGLPIARVLNIILGNDGKTIAELRGLYAWLAALAPVSVRERLSRFDPMTTIAYGDVVAFTLGEKRQLLLDLKNLAATDTGFRRRIEHSTGFSALATAELATEFCGDLQAKDRSDAHQAYVDCVLTILKEGKAPITLRDDVFALINDTTRWQRIREHALDAWLSLGAPDSDVLRLLDHVTAGSVSDPDDSFAGALLLYLYPRAIPTANVMTYFHARKNPHLLGSYSWFWSCVLAERAIDEALCDLLDQVAAQDKGPLSVRAEEHYELMVDALFIRAIRVHGDSITPQQCSLWLSIGERRSDRQQRSARDKKISQWLSEPARYKALMAQLYAEAEAYEKPIEEISRLRARLDGVEAPKDLPEWHLEQAARATNELLATDHLREACQALFARPSLTIDVLHQWRIENPIRAHFLTRRMQSDLPENYYESSKRWPARTVVNADARRQLGAFLHKHIKAIESGTFEAARMHELARVWLGQIGNVRGTTPKERFADYCDHSEPIYQACALGFRNAIGRANLPSATEIVALRVKQQEHLIRNACLLGMGLLWQDGTHAIDGLPNDIVKRVVAFRLTYAADATPDWFTYLAQQRPGLVSEVLTHYARACFRTTMDRGIDGLHALAKDPRYESVARLTVPTLLRAFPIRATANKLYPLAYLLKAALRYDLDVTALARQKLRAKSMDTGQRVYWLTMAMLRGPKRFQTDLWKYVEKSPERVTHLANLLRVAGRLDTSLVLSVTTLAELIRILTPHIDPTTPLGGYVPNEAMQLADLVRDLVRKLAAIGNQAALDHIVELKADVAVSKLKFLLEEEHHALQVALREQAFEFMSPREIATILANGEPRDMADLSALVLGRIDEIAHRIRTQDTSMYRAFWNVAKGKTPTPREENLCRDQLLDYLRLELTRFECQPEAIHVSDTRSDIRIGYQSRLELPIEIKRQQNVGVWTSLRSQLIAKYTIASKSHGFGIYVIFWFGVGTLAAAPDGLKKPKSAAELQERLANILSAEERTRVFVRVIDVSWPL
jgi:hypothetical protein